MLVGKSSLIILSVVFLLLRLPMAAQLWAGQTQLSWQAPTTNEDGTQVTDLTSFRIHYGTQSRGSTLDPHGFQYQQTLTIAASQTTYTVTGLTEGIQYFFSVTALDSSGNQSIYSNEANKTIAGGGTSSILLSANFDTGANGFAYIDDAFRNTHRPKYASGAVSAGRLRVTLGGRNDTAITNGMSGGWRRSFTVEGSTVASVTLSFRYNLTQSSNYESDEYSDMLVTMNTQYLGTSGQTYVARIAGDGNGGSTRTTGWQTFTTTRQLTPGTYTLTLGGYNNKKTFSDEVTTVLIDDVTVSLNTTSVQAAQTSLQEAQTEQFTQPMVASVQAIQQLQWQAQPVSSTATTTQEMLRRQRAADTSRFIPPVTTTGQAPQKIWLEAEAGQLTEPMAIENDAAGAADQYIWVPEGMEDALEASQTAGVAQYTLTIDVPGFYVIWGRLQPGAHGTGSFFLTLNTDPSLVWEFSESVPGDEGDTEPIDRADMAPGEWQWQQAFQKATPVLFLEAGVHTLTLQHRQAGIKLDRLFLTNDLEFVPQD